MGVIVESCKQHVHCCNKEEKKEDTELKNIQKV